MSGETYALCGQKFLKDDNMIDFLGEVDELNCHLGLIKAVISGERAYAASSEEINAAGQFIEGIQIKLMKLMSHASDTARSDYFFSEGEVTDLEDEISRMKKKAAKLAEFVLPGKNSLEAQIHIARAVARRAERCFFSVSEASRGPLCKNAGAYLNRLSGYLFILSCQEF